MNRYSDMTINQLKAELRLVEDELICRGCPVNESKGGDFYDPSTRCISETGKNAVVGDRASTQTREQINEPPQSSSAGFAPVDKPGPASGSPDLQSELAQAKHDLAREMTLLGQERELNVNLEGELDKMRKEKFTHAYCDNCEAVQETEQHPFVMPSVNGKTLGGDITCKVCHWIIATVGIKTIPSTDLTTLGERGEK